ncbi:serine acetyltransferase, partial [bacterium]|nr:serine acetyltransferase [bacterium]
TTVIGRNVKLYQGVTLGAKSFPPNAREARNSKRHPTIEDDVIIYANATILGDVTIGKGATIGGNSWMTSNVAPGSVVTFRS